MIRTSWHWPNRTQIAILAVLALSLILGALLLRAYWLAIALVGGVVFIILTIIEPYLGLGILIVICLVHPEHRYSALEPFRLHNFMGALILVSWYLRTIKKREWIFPVIPQIIMLAALYLAMAASVAGAWDTALVIAGLDSFTSVAFIFIMIISMADKQHKLKYIVWMIILAVTITAIQGIRSSEITFEDGVARVSIHNYNREYGGPNSLSTLMLMAFPLSWAAMIATRRPFNLLPLAFCGLYAIIIVKTGSRGAFLAFAIMMVLLIATGPKKSRHYALPAIAIVIIAFLFFAPSGYLYRMSTMLDEDEGTNRMAIINAGIDMFMGSPIFGIGLSNFALHTTAGGFVNALGQGFVSHNAYVQILVETGIMGFIPFTLLLVTSLVDLWRTLRLIENREEFAFLRMLAWGLMISITTLMIRLFFITMGFQSILYIVLSLSASLKLTVNSEVVAANQE